MIDQLLRIRSKKATQKQNTLFIQKVAVSVHVGLKNVFVDVCKDQAVIQMRYHIDISADPQNMLTLISLGILRLLDL